MLIDFPSHAWLDKLAAGAVRSLAEKAHIPAFTDGTLADTRRVLHGQGVDTFVLLNIAVAPRTERHVNDFAISLVHEADIIPFGSVHPDSENALAELARLKAAGVKGVKFHNEYQNFFVDDEKAFPLYERCAEHGRGGDRGARFHNGVHRYELRLPLRLSRTRRKGHPRVRGGQGAVRYGLPVGYAREHARVAG